VIRRQNIEIRGIAGAGAGLNKLEVKRNILRLIMRVTIKD
jgi:hypothetical protein